MHLLLATVFESESARAEACHRWKRGRQTHSRCSSVFGRGCHHRPREDVGRMVQGRVSSHLVEHSGRLYGVVEQAFGTVVALCCVCRHLRVS